MNLSNYNELGSALADAGMIFESLTQGKSYVREDMPPAIVQEVPAERQTQVSMNREPPQHRPQGIHNPGSQQPKYEPPAPHVYNPDAECPIDDVPSDKQEGNKPPQTNIVCNNKNDNKRYTIQNIPAGGITPQNIDKVIVKPFGTNTTITDSNKKRSILQGCNLINF